MTREEAIKKIKKVIEESVIFEDELEAFDMAIKALEQEPCDDAISRQAMFNILLKYTLGESRIAEELNALPHVTPEQRSGRWIPLEYDGYADGNPVWDKWECSECGWEHNGDEESLTTFCPNCGAKMEVEE